MLRVDVDAAPDVSSKYGVRAMYVTPFPQRGYLLLMRCIRPTFIFLKGSRQVDQVQGANRGWVRHVEDLTFAHELRLVDSRMQSNDMQLLALLHSVARDRLLEDPALRRPQRLPHPLELALLRACHPLAG
jgi:hypothetical protein